jgi:hypothetical protein
MKRIGLLLAVLALAGCSASNPVSEVARLESGAALARVDSTGKNAHPYFPIVPGAYKDYRITLAGIGTRMIRVTTGLPELFFDRMATPFVYSAVPGEIPDSVVVGLRQYWSIAPDGALWFHGARNGIVSAHSVPPVRNLLAKPKPGDAWADTVLFESFIGGVPFLRNYYLYDWKLSDVTVLDLPAGSYRALRATSIINDAPPEEGALALAQIMRSGDGLRSRRGVALAPTPEPVDIFRGWWFARHDGTVAKDWPFGEGTEFINIATYELVGEGMGPVPPPWTPPPPGGTE